MQNKCKKNNRRLPSSLQRIVLNLSSGLLLVLAFNVSNLWFLGLVALVPILFVLKNTRSELEAVLHGFSMGLIYFGSVLLFFFSAHPLSWAGIENPTASIISISITWLLSSGIFATGPAIFAAVIHRLKNSRFLFLFAPIIWVLTEFFQSTLFSILLAGEGGLVGPHWTLGFLGYILAENIFLLSLSALGGIFILSFVVVLINTFLFRLIESRRLGRHEIITAAAVVIAACACFFYPVNPSGTKEVAAIHTNFKPNVLQDVNQQEEQFDTIDGLLRDLATSDDHFDIIILPENSFYFSQLPKISQRYRLDSLSGDDEVLIIDSIRTDDVGRDESFVAFMNSESDEVVLRNKRLLMPQGEYLSYSFAWFGKIFFGKEWYESFIDKRAVEKGEEMVVGHSRDTKVGALFCSEVMTPNIYRDATKAGAELLTNSASHSVFTNSKNLEDQILKYSKLRAVENGRYYVQAGNRTSSFILNHKGAVVRMTSSNDNQVLISAVETFDHRTPFNLIGSEGVFLVFIFAVVGLLYIERQKSNPQHRM